MTSDAGMVPYFCEWRCYDYVGLGDVHIAHYQNDLEYMSELSPDVILVKSHTPSRADIADSHHEDLLMAHIDESQAYEQVAASFWRINYYLLSFVKRSLPDFDGIAAALRENERVSLRENRHVGVSEVLGLQHLFARTPEPRSASVGMKESISP